MLLYWPSSNLVKKYVTKNKVLIASLVFVIIWSTGNLAVSVLGKGENTYPVIAVWDDQDIPILGMMMARTLEGLCMFW